MPHSIVRQLTIRNTLIQEQSNSLPNCLQWTSKMVSHRACLDSILALESVTSNDHPTRMPSHDRPVSLSLSLKPATRLLAARYHYASSIESIYYTYPRSTLTAKHPGFALWTCKYSTPVSPNILPATSSSSLPCNASEPTIMCRPS
jgi:hypothetical protein